LTQARAKTILLTSFAVLTPMQRERLRWHAKQKTPICCGRDAQLYVDGEGGG